jgi:hypothetical protein
MSIMLITKIRNTLPQNMANRQRLCIAKKLELFMKIIMQLKGDTFHFSAECMCIVQQYGKRMSAIKLNCTIFDKKRIGL